MEKSKLDEILREHAAWLANKEDGEEANLQEADLQGADLQGADLHGADLHGANLQEADLLGANLREADLQGARLREANLRGANLQGANLQGARLQGANLQGADLDYSCLPLWCGGSRFTCDARFVRQLFAHISTLMVEDADDSLKAALAAIRPEAEKSHRAEDLGLIDLD